MLPTEIYHYIVSKMDGFERENMKLVCKMFEGFRFNIKSDNPARDREVLLIDCDRRFYELFKYGHLDIIKQCYRRYGTYNKIFSSACRYGFTEFAKKLYDERGGRSLCTNISITEAIKGNNINIIKMISGFRFIDSISYLEIACKKGNIEIFNYLLPMVTYKPFTGMLINAACFSGSMRMLERVIGLLEYGVSPGLLNVAFRKACRGGNMDIINFMIKVGANDWNAGFDGACLGGHIEIAKLMIEKGASRVTDIYSACEGGHIDILKMQIELGANDFDEGFIAAVTFNRIEIVKFLIDKNVDIKNSLETITSMMSAELIEFLIEMGAIVNKDSLAQAIRLGDLRLVKLFIKHGAKKPKSMHTTDRRIARYLESI